MEWKGKFVQGRKNTWDERIQSRRTLQLSEGYMVRGTTWLEKIHGKMDCIAGGLNSRECTLRVMYSTGTVQ